MADLKASFDELPSSETIITEQKLTEELKATKKTLADLKESFDKYPPSDEIITEQIYKAKLLELSDSVNNIRKAFNDDLDSKLNPIDDKLKKQRTDIDKLREEFDALPEEGVMARLKAAGIDVAMLDDGRIHKVGSVISKVLKNNDNQISRIIHELPTSIAYRQPNLLRNLNTDIVREYWQAATTY